MISRLRLSLGISTLGLPHVLGQNVYRAAGTDCRSRALDFPVLGRGLRQLGVGAERLATERLDAAHASGQPDVHW